MKRPRYVIFDCDGVLVDSEILANRVEAEMKTELGLPTTLEDQIQRFVGLANNHPVMLEELEKLPPDYLSLVDRRLEGVYEKELKAIAGIAEVLSELKLPKCVASNSELEWIRKKLALTSLDRHFPPEALFSGHMVRQGKPAPDLFLMAAERMGWKPSECLVIEDSVAGVTGGKAAGMTVCGFLGGLHLRPGHADRLFAAGADFVVSDVRKILPLIA